MSPVNIRLTVWRSDGRVARTTWRGQSLGAERRSSPKGKGEEKEDWLETEHVMSTDDYLLITT